MASPIQEPPRDSQQGASQPGSGGDNSHHRRSISAILDQQALEQIIPTSEGARQNISNPPAPSIAPVQPMGSTNISTYELNSGTHSVSGPRHEALPDLLNSHVLPPHHMVPGAPNMLGPHPGLHMQPDPRLYSYRQPPRHHRGHHSNRRRHRSRNGSHSEEDTFKASCLSCLAASTSFRWILVILSLLGVCCVVTGIVLAALHAAGNSFLFLAIMFIGLGILLVVVVAVGWKCTPRGHEPLHALFGLGEFQGRDRSRTRSDHRHRSRNHPRRRADGQWYGGVMYPEFQYRRPPPSYNASMEEFQQQLAIANSVNMNINRGYDPDDTPAEDYSLPGSPPPSYRSRASTVRTGIQITFPPSHGDQPTSRPPTYRSHVGVEGPHSPHPRPTLPRDQDGNISTEDISVSVHQSSANNTDAVTNVQYLHPPTQASAQITINSLTVPQIAVSHSSNSSSQNEPTSSQITIQSSNIPSSSSSSSHLKEQSSSSSQETVASSNSSRPKGESTSVSHSTTVSSSATKHSSVSSDNSANIPGSRTSQVSSEGATTSIEDDDMYPMETPL